MDTECPTVKQPNLYGVIAIGILLLASVMEFVVAYQMMSIGIPSIIAILC